MAFTKTILKKKESFLRCIRGITSVAFIKKKEGKLRWFEFQDNEK